MSDNPVTMQIPIKDIGKMRDLVERALHPMVRYSTNTAVMRDERDRLREADLKGLKKMLDEYLEHEPIVG